MLEFICFTAFIILCAAVFFCVGYQAGRGDGNIKARWEMLDRYEDELNGYYASLQKYERTLKDLQCRLENEVR